MNLPEDKCHQYFSLCAKAVATHREFLQKSVLQSIATTRIVPGERLEIGRGVFDAFW